MAAPWRVPMAGRAPDETGRTATTLELFFDLVFVVAVAFAASSLHHALAEGADGESIVHYAQVFFAIWWAWMNFTWFASAYDTDDVPYRLTTFVGITGALILAAGVPDAFENGDYTIVTIGYVTMRLALVSFWIRAGRADPGHSATTSRYATGVTLVQICWVLLLFAPEGLLGVGFLVLVVAELLVPVWAEATSPTTWHREHIEERYGLFTIIVLGESILASSIALQAVISEGTALTDLLPIIVGGLLAVFSMWWLYFELPRHMLLGSLRSAFIWGYGHYFIWGSAAAVGAGLAVAIDRATNHGETSDFGAGNVVAIPAAVFLVTLWIFNYLPREAGTRLQTLAGPVAAGLILLTPLTGQAVLLTGLIMAALLGTKLIMARRRPTEPSPEGV